MSTVFLMDRLKLGFILYQYAIKHNEKYTFRYSVLNPTTKSDSDGTKSWSTCSISEYTY